jgi:hypothetical protein
MRDKPITRLHCATQMYRFFSFIPNKQVEAKSSRMPVEKIRGIAWLI